MQLDRVTGPLAVLVRVAFVGVIAAAFVVDGWLMHRWGSRRSMLPIFGIAVAGVVWAYWTRTLLVIAVATTAMSLLATNHIVDHDVRFPVFTEFTVIPVLVGALLHRWRPLPGLVAAPLAFAGLLVATRSEARAIRGVTGAAMLVLLGAATAAVVYVRVRESERRTSIERAREHERLELARELHDVVGHHVTGIVVAAQARRFTAATNGAIDPAEDETLAEIERAGLDTMTSIRRLVGLLRTSPSTSSGPRLANIERMIDELRRTHRHARFEADETVRQRWLPTELAVTVERLVHETTTNIRKYGDPDGVVVIEVHRRDGAVEFRADNVIGRSGRADGYGLVGMRERVEALGGTFVAGDDDAGRWTVRVVIPLAVDE